MEITNVCPYCGREMREGALPVYKYALRWCPDNGRGGIEEEKSVRLSGTPVIESVYAPARYCESCRVVIVPVPEIETFSDKAGKWLDKTLGSLGDFRDFAWLSVCGFLYQCGVSVVITLSAVYAAAVMGFKTEDTLLMVFLVNITAAVGAFAFGYVQDRIGHKLALAGTLCVWIAMIAVAAALVAGAFFVVLVLKPFSRTDVPKSLSAGYDHTVGLRSDGSVVACGRDDHGQCDVSGWTGVTAVSAGWYHTVGLRRGV